MRSYVFFFKQKTAYEMRISDWSSDVCSSDLEHVTFEAVLDGELLVVAGGEVRPFNDLQQRLNRKTVTAAMLREFPAFVRLYDILFDGDADLRALPLVERLARLAAFFARAAPPRMDLSVLVDFADGRELAAIRAGARAASTAGLLLNHIGQASSWERVCP